MFNNISQRSTDMNVIMNVYQETLIDAMLERCAMLIVCLSKVAAMAASLSGNGLEIC